MPNPRGNPNLKGNKNSGRRTKEKEHSIIGETIKKMEAERDRILIAMKSKDLSEVQYDSLNRGIDLLTKNIQLLSGGKTESNEMIIKWE